MIRAIETRYNGYLFRSRLEARWAVFFDTWYWTDDYQYEPEGYEFSGKRYLPDFYLPQLDCFFEVKGIDPSEEYQDMLISFCAESKKNLVLAIGAFGDSQKLVGFINMTEHRVTRWSPMVVRVCCDCGKFMFINCIMAAMGVARGHINICECDFPGCGINTAPVRYQHLALKVMYRNAKSARFEHGESGAKPLSLQEVHSMSEPEW